MSFVYSDVNSLTPTLRPLLTDTESVYQALFNLFNTKPGDRLFQPEYGFDLENELFELIDDLGALEVLRQVFDVVQRWEPRVLIDAARSKVTPLEDQNKYELYLSFAIQGVEGQTYSFTGSFTSS